MVGSQHSRVVLASGTELSVSKWRRRGLLSCVVGVSAFDVPTLFSPPFPRMRHAVAYSDPGALASSGARAASLLCRSGLDFVYFRFCPKGVCREGRFGKMHLFFLSAPRLIFLRDWRG